VLAIEPQSADASAALDLLQAWDGVVSAESPAATVYGAFISEIWRRVAEARAPRSYQYALGRGFADLLNLTTFAAGRVSRLLALLREQPEGWFDRPWAEVIDEALAAAVQRLRHEHGVSPAGWAWGKVRPLTLQHPLGRITALAPVFNRGPFPWGGDGNTVSQAGNNPRRFGGNPIAIASLRAVIDVSAWDAARFSLPGGQSGNPFSPHYDDLLPLWLRGEGVPIPWSTEAVRKATRATLRLLPLD
jgi:penicillin amidase